MIEKDILFILILVAIASLVFLLIFFRNSLFKAYHRLKIILLSGKSNKTNKDKSKITKYCPYCNEELKYSEIYCHNCDREILNNQFNLSHFLLENASLFTVIGVIGTFTALLPSIAKLYYRVEDLSALPYPQNFFLLSSVILNSLLISFIIALLIIKSIYPRKNEPSVGKIRRIKCGDPERLLFYLVFIIPLFFIVVFLWNIFPNLSNMYWLIFISFLLFIFYLLISMSSKGIYKKIFQYISFILLICAIISVVCLLIQVSPKEEPEIDSSKVYISNDAEYYTPSLSQSIGIGLSPSPSNVSGRNLNNVEFYWDTNFGYFIDWLPSESRVVLLGNSTSHDYSKLYWTYYDDETNDQKPPVTINLTIKKKDTGEKVNRSLNLTWINNNTVQVSN